MVYEEFISYPQTIDTNNIVFGKPKELQGGKRIPIYIVEDGKKSPLYLQMGTYHCFGLQAQTPFQSSDKTVIGYQMPIPMWDMEGATEDQKLFLDVFQKIANRCADHLLTPSVKKELKKPNLVKEAFVDTFTPLWYKKKDDLSPDLTKSPTMYAKLFTDRGSGDITISTQFCTADGYSIEPLTLLNKNFRFERALVQISGIFIGTTIKLQVKIKEVEVEASRKKSGTLLVKPRPVSPVNQDIQEETVLLDQPQGRSPGQEQEGEYPIEEPELPVFDDFKKEADEPAETEGVEQKRRYRKK